MELIGIIIFMAVLIIAVHRSFPGIKYSEKLNELTDEEIHIIKKYIGKLKEPSNMIGKRQVWEDNMFKIIVEMYNARVKIFGVKNQFYHLMIYLCSGVELDKDPKEDYRKSLETIKRIKKYRY